MFDVDRFVADCRDALRETQPALAVKELLERVVAHPAAIDATLGASDRGGFRTLHHSAQLTVLQLIWPPAVVLFPHDHRMWAANGIYGGAEDNTYFRRVPRGTIQRSGGTRLETGTVALLGADAIHAVSNPSAGYTAAIHVYGGDYFATPRSQWDPATLAEQPFDVDAVRQVLADADARTRSEAE